MNLRRWVCKPYKGDVYRTKKEATPHAWCLGSWCERVDFRFQTMWIVRMPDDGITEVNLHDGTRLIGYDDPYMCSNTLPLNESFLLAIRDRQKSLFDMTDKEIDELFSGGL